MYGTGDILGPLGPLDPRDMAGYRLLARIGEGGMGTVYLSHTRGGQPVALKVVRREYGQDADFRRRFEQEVQAARRVQGYHIVPVVDHDTTGELPWLASTFVPGIPLHDALAAYGPLPLPATFQLVGCAARALSAVHAADVVHRDLKPSNILLGPAGPYVIDFGIARAADATQLTQSGGLIGTPQYMSPEHALGERVTAATDVFSLGLIAAVAATGRHPYGDGGAITVAAQIANTAHRPPDLAPYPEQLRDLLERCLTADPGTRIGTEELMARCQEAAGRPLNDFDGWLPEPLTTEIARRGEAAKTPPAPAAPPVPGTPPVPEAPPVPVTPPAPETPPAPAAPPGAGTPPGPGVPPVPDRAPAATPPVPSTPPVPPAAPEAAPPVPPAPGAAPSVPSAAPSIAGPAGGAPPTPGGAPQAPGAVPSVPFVVPTHPGGVPDLSTPAYGHPATPDPDAAPGSPGYGYPAVGADAPAGARGGAHQGVHAAPGAAGAPDDGAAAFGAAGPARPQVAAPTGTFGPAGGPGGVASGTGPVRGPGIGSGPGPGGRKPPRRRARIALLASALVVAVAAGAASAVWLTGGEKGHDDTAAGGGRTTAKAPAASTPAGAGNGPSGESRAPGTPPKSAHYTVLFTGKHLTIRSPQEFDATDVDLDEPKLDAKDRMDAKVQDIRVTGDEGWQFFTTVGKTTGTSPEDCATGADTDALPTKVAPDDISQKNGLINEGDHLCTITQDGNLAMLEITTVTPAQYSFTTPTVEGTVTLWRIDH